MILLREASNSINLSDQLGDTKHFPAHLAITNHQYCRFKFHILPWHTPHGDIGLRLRRATS